MIDKGTCDKGFIWNSSNGECEFDKSFDIDEYLDYENCKFIKKLVDKLAEKYTETDEEVKLAKVTLAENKSKRKRSSVHFQYIFCTLYIVNNLYNKRWKWNLFYLIQIQEL